MMHGLTVWACSVGQRDHEVSSGLVSETQRGTFKTRDAVTGHLDRLLGRAADPALLDELEVALISADLGMPVVERVMEHLRAQMRGGNFPLPRRCGSCCGNPSSTFCFPHKRRRSTNSLHRGRARL